MTGADSDRIADVLWTDLPPVVAPASAAAPEPRVAVRLRVPATNALWYQQHPRFREWYPRVEAAGCIALDVPEAAVTPWWRRC